MHGAMAVLSRSISLALTCAGWFSVGTPVRKTWIRSARWMPGVPGSESGTSVPYTALSRCGSSGSWTSGRAAPSALGLEELK